MESNLIDDMRPIFNSAMSAALKAAVQAGSQELPIGASLSSLQGEIFMTAGNSCALDDDISGHAEIKLLRQVGRQFLLREAESLIIAVTLEPCPMCAWAIRSSGIKRVIIGTANPNYGACGSMFDLVRWGKSKVEVNFGILEAEARELLKRKFLELREPV